MKVLHLFCRQTGTRPIHVTIPKRYVYFWEVSHFLSKQKGIDLESIDCLDLNYSIFNLTKKIAIEKPKVVIVLIRIENIYQTLSLISHIKVLDPEIRIIAYGDIVNYVPNFFESNKYIDALVESGDWELSLLSYLKYLKSKKSKLEGVYVRSLKKRFAGRYFAKNEWCFPDISKVPESFYTSLNEGKRQIAISVGKGCPYNCKFCLSVCTFGVKDRRKSPKEIIDFIDKNKKKFDSFKLFVPSFNVDNKWVEKFCLELIKRNLKISWCTSSRIDLMDDERIIKLMSQSGCYKVSVGIETINNSSKFLKKEFPKDQIIRVASYFSKYKMMLKGLVMLGVPYQTKQDIFESLILLKENNIKIRPTSYSPLSELKKGKLSLERIQKYDKFTYYKYGVKGITRSQYFNLLVDSDNFLEILK